MIHIWCLIKINLAIHPVWLIEEYTRSDLILVILNIITDGIIILIVIIIINIIGFNDDKDRTFSGMSFWNVRAKNNNIQFISLIVIIIQRWNGGIPSLIISDEVNIMLRCIFIIIGLIIIEYININDARVWIKK